MKAIEGAIYCKNCVGTLVGSRGLALRYPASHDGGKGTCGGCGETIELRGASKVIKKEKKKK